MDPAAIKAMLAEHERHMREMLKAVGVTPPPVRVITDAVQSSKEDLPVTPPDVPYALLRRAAM